ncbi:MAG: ATP-dependent Clp protease ATP-binding subunit, partial [Clostridiales bacterium]|nr:ATP-dependent Clp protease ATP-binding subunit [Clostridiales bacterium]
MMQLCSKCKKRPAVVFISELENGKMTPKGLCLTCAKEAGIQPVNDMLEKMNISDEDIEQMNSQFMDFMSMTEENGDGDSFEPGGAATFPFLQNIFGSAENDRPAGAEKDAGEEEKRPEGREKRKKKSAAKKRRFLDQYCVNLTARAKAGELDAIIGRQAELYRTIQILSRRTKNNPCLIGEPGVGKT